MILWERRGTTFPVAFSHRRCRAVKRPACSKIKWGVERIGLICKAIGCREGRKIITLRRKTKCLLNHFKQYRTMWWAPRAAPQNKKRSHGESGWTIKWNLISWSSSQRWVRLLGDLGGWAPPSTINKVTLGHYVAITWTLSDNCTSEEHRLPCTTKLSLLFLSVWWREQHTGTEVMTLGEKHTCPNSFTICSPSFTRAGQRTKTFLRWTAVERISTTISAMEGW